MNVMVLHVPASRFRPGDLHILSPPRRSDRGPAQHLGGVLCHDNLCKITCLVLVANRIWRANRAAKSPIRAYAVHTGRYEPRGIRGHKLLRASRVTCSPRRCTDQGSTRPGRRACPIARTPDQPDPHRPAQKPKPHSIFMRVRRFSFTQFVTLSFADPIGNSNRLPIRIAQHLFCNLSVGTGGPVRRPCGL